MIAGKKFKKKGVSYMALPGLKFHLDVSDIVFANPGSIENVVAEYFSIPINKMVGKSRKGEVLFPRYVAMALLKKHTKLSLRLIGQRFSGRDHSTVIKALHNVVDFCDSSQWHRMAFNDVDNLIGNMYKNKHIQ